MNEALEWYRSATPEERWEFLIKLGGDPVSDNVCYMYPNHGKMA